MIGSIDFFSGDGMSGAKGEKVFKSHKSLNHYNKKDHATSLNLLHDE